MKEKRVLFMGTPEFSVNVLEKLIEYTTVVGVVCQPDKEVGRKKVLTKCPVKVVAEQNNIKVFQPYKLKEEYESILEVNPDVIITCAYGQMLNEEFLNYPKYKTINVHASILPKLRGGAPIERAIMEGYVETGITIMRTDKGMDSGDIITSKSIIIEDTDTKESLSNKLSILGAELLIETLPSIFDETCSYIKQNHDEKTIARIITKEDEYLSFDDTKKNIYNKVRALYPEPACYATLDNERIKIYETTIGDNMCGENGKVIEIYDDGIGVSCKDGEIIIKKLQVAGKKAMTAREYLNGVNKDKLLGKVFNK
ncbi:MAG: methionyl-tRNA formyltransferase [Firmicutes bacterium]|nr:methionyl-tRNA formyltransferase [Bacillota bacterium]